MSHTTTWHIVLLALIALISVATAADASIVSGVVTDGETREPLPYATVVMNVNLGAAAISRGAMADLSGRYTILNVPPGRYEIRFVYVGYEQFADSVTVRTGFDVEYDAVLKPQPIELDEIIVEGDRLDAEREIQPSFVSFDAEALGAIPGFVESDLIRSLQLLPGVQAASDISSGLYVRGGGPDQTLVLLDGVTVYNPTHAFGLFSTFNPDVMGDVTLYKGAYPAEYGGRLSAVLDVNSRELGGEGVHGVIGLSTIAARGTITGKIGDNDWLVGARRTFLEPLLNALSTPENPVPSYYFYDLNARWQTKRGGRSWTEITAYLGRDNIRLDADEDTFIDIAWGNTLLAAKHNVLIGESLLGSIALAASQYESLSEGRFFTTGVEIENRIRELTILAELGWNPSPHHTVGFGLQSSVYDVTYRDRFNQVPQTNFERRPAELTAYLEDKWIPWIGTTLRGGVRVRYLSDGERLLIEPRFSLSQALTDKIRVKYGGGVYNQYLQLVSTEAFSAGDFYVPIDETAVPGRSWQSVIGLSWDPTRQYRVTVEGYYTRLDNLVNFNNNRPADDASFRTVDIFNTGGEGFASGGELFLEKRAGALTGWIGYALGWTRRQFEQLNGGERFPPKYDRRHDISVVGNYRRSKWSYGAAFVYGTGQAFTPASARYLIRSPATGDPRDAQILPAARNSARLLPYHRLDVSVARDFRVFGLKAQGMLQVFNLYSRRNEWFVQYDTDGQVTTPEIIKQLPIIPSLGVNFEF